MGRNQVKPLNACFKYGLMMHPLGPKCNNCLKGKPIESYTSIKQEVMGGFLAAGWYGFYIVKIVLQMSYRGCVVRLAVSLFVVTKCR